MQLQDYNLKTNYHLLDNHHNKDRIKVFILEFLELPQGQEAMFCQVFLFTLKNNNHQNHSRLQLILDDHSLFIAEYNMLRVQIESVKG